MKFQLKNIFTYAAGILLIAGGFIFLHYHPQHNQVNQELSYKPLVKPEDLAPLPKPPLGRELKLPILMYHHVGDPPPKPSLIRRDLTVPTADFEKEVKWLAQAGYQSVRLEDIYLYTKGRTGLPKKPIIFTFDDGYQDVFTNALPILKKYGFIASFGIITSYPNQTQGDNFYAPWSDISQAAAAGNEIVCHTQNHFDGSNPKYSFDYIFANLNGCKKDLAAQGINGSVLIYPYGHYTVGYVVQAKKAGFVMGVTVHEGSRINLDDLMEIPRIRVHGHEDLERFIELIKK